MRTISFIIANVFLFYLGHSQSRLIGRILYHNSGEKPAQGVEVSALGANSVFTASNGLFTLTFNHKKPGDRIKLLIGNTDGNGKSIVLVNKKTIKTLSIPSRPDENPVEIFVSSPGQLTKSKAQYYGILEKEVSGRYDKRLSNIEKQLKQKNLYAKTTAILTTQIEELHKERDSAMAKIEEQAVYIAKINKDMADEKLKSAIEDMEKGEYITSALALVNSFYNSYLPEAIYYGIDIAFPSLPESRWGLKAGMYKNTISKSLEEFMLRPHHYELIDIDMGENIYNLVQTGMAPAVLTQSLGFYVEFPYTIITPGNFDLAIAPHAELIRRSSIYGYEVKYETILTTLNTSEDLEFPKPLIPKELYSVYWESYLGIAFPIQYRAPSKVLEIAINPIFGAGYPGPSVSFITFYTGIQDYEYVRFVEDDTAPFFLVLSNAIS